MLPLGTNADLFLIHPCPSLLDQGLRQQGGYFPCIGTCTGVGASRFLGFPPTPPIIFLGEREVVFSWPRPSAPGLSCLWVALQGWGRWG